MKLETHKISRKCFNVINDMNGVCIICKGTFRQLFMEMIANWAIEKYEHRIRIRRIKYQLKLITFISMDQMNISDEFCPN